VLISLAVVLSLVVVFTYMSSPANPRPRAEAKFAVLLADNFVVVGAYRRLVCLGTLGPGPGGQRSLPGVSQSVPSTVVCH
jgi:hypothetical protein